VESACKCGGFLFCGWDVALGHVIARAENVGPPGKQGFDQRSASLEVKTFRQRLVVFLSFFQPGPVRCILVAHLLSVQRVISFVFYLLTYASEQLLKFLRKSIGKLNTPVGLTGGLLK